jgi:hypothetical protein
MDGNQRSSLTVNQVRELQMDAFRDGYSAGYDDCKAGKQYRPEQHLTR